MQSNATSLVDFRPRLKNWFVCDTFEGITTTLYMAEDISSDMCDIFEGITTIVGHV